LNRRSLILVCIRKWRGECVNVRVKWRIFLSQSVMVSVLVVGLLVIPATAQEPATADANLATNNLYMLGDWAGERTRLASRGVVLDVFYVNDFFADAGGALGNWSRLRGTLDIDFGKANMVRGLKFHIAAMWQAGGNIASYLNTIANPSSNASFNLTRLDSWWFEQAFANDKVFLRVGQFAGFDSYGVQQDGETYLNEPMGYALGNLFAADYEPFAPAATPAAEVRYVPSKYFYAKSAIFSGNRNPLHDDVTGTHLKFKDTPVIATEAGFLVDPTPSLEAKTYPGSYKVGATINPGQFSNIVTGQETRTNYLIYFMANQRIYRRQAGSDRGIDLNFAYDWSPADFTKNFSQITAGARYHGLVPHRERDTVSCGIVYSRISGALNQALSHAGLSPLRAEKALEINYTMKLTPWLTFQPVLEYYFDTGGRPNSRTTIAGFRTTFGL
jgi:porin